METEKEKEIHLLLKQILYYDDLDDVDDEADWLCSRLYTTWTNQNQHK